MYKYKHDIEYFKNIDTRDKAYWLGFLYADGCLYKRSVDKGWKGYNFELSIKEADKSHLLKFGSAIKCDVPIKNKIVELENYGTYSHYRLMFFCQDFAKHLISCGCIPQKSLSLEFPNEKILKRDFYNDFVRGYFDGDGCIWYGYKKSNRQTTCSFSIVGTSDIINNIAKILYDESGVSIPKKYACGKSFQSWWYGFKNCKKIYAYLYQGNFTCLQNKKDIFDKIFAHKRGDTFIAADKDEES